MVAAARPELHRRRSSRAAAGGAEALVQCPSLLGIEASKNRREELGLGAGALGGELGETLERSGRRLEAIEAYREGLKRQPDGAEVHAQLGLALARLGDATKA